MSLKVKAGGSNVALLTTDFNKCYWPASDLAPELADDFRKLIEVAATYIPEDKAADFTSLYPLWIPDAVLKAGDKVQFDGVLYRVLSDHTSAESWKPDVSPSLYAKVLVSEDPAVVLDWEQPDSTNGYSAGNLVKHNGKIWESQIDSNIWEPGVVGTESLWKEKENA